MVLSSSKSAVQGHQARSSASCSGTPSPLYKRLAIVLASLVALLSQPRGERRLSAQVIAQCGGHNPHAEAPASKDGVGDVLVRCCCHSPPFTRRTPRHSRARTVSTVDVSGLPGLAGAEIRAQPQLALRTAVRLRPKTRVTALVSGFGPSQDHTPQEASWQLTRHLCLEQRRQGRCTTRWEASDPVVCARALPVPIMVLRDTLD